jgi:hypothetical protein
MPASPGIPGGPGGPCGPCGPCGPIVDALFINFIVLSVCLTQIFPLAVLTAISPVTKLAAVGVIAAFVLYGKTILIAIFYFFSIDILF